MSITTSFFGRTAAGEPVLQYTLRNRSGASVQVLSFGATIRSIKVPDWKGDLVDVVLGFDTVAEYEQDGAFIGRFVGRYGNRLAKSRFVLDGVTYQLTPNEGENHLHGTYHNRVLPARVEGDTLTFEVFSPDGEEGYPGNLSILMSYTFDEDNMLTIDYRAKTDKPTVLNLTNHSYFNLGGHDSGDILDTVLRLACSRMTEGDSASIMTGNILSVKGTPFDFTEAKPIGQDIEADFRLLRYGCGYDHNMIIDQPSMACPCAEAYSPKTGITLRTYTTQPAVQFYAGNFIAPDGPRKGKGGATYDKRYAFCLETQHYPCSPDFEHFPSTVLRPGEELHEVTVYEFTCEN